MARNPNGSSALSFGTAMKPCRKNQDRLSHTSFGNENGELGHAFAVFDGHGQGTNVADKLSSNLLDLIKLKIGQGESHAEASTNAFEEVQHAVESDPKISSNRDGSTATVVLLERDLDGWNCTCAWVGDSRAIIIDKSCGKVIRLSEDHRLELDRERKRVMDFHDRETSMGVHQPRKTVVTSTPIEKSRLRPWSNTEILERVLNESTGVSLMLTRALGDCLASPAISAVPDINSCHCSNSSRIIIASDGVWDALSEYVFFVFKISIDYS